MLFASEKRPNGPNINQFDDISIDLSGIQLKFGMPAGNSPDSLDDKLEPAKRHNIYENSTQTKLNTDSKLIVSRWFNYSGFLGKNLGSVQFNVNLYYVNGTHSEFNDPKHFKEYVQQYLKYHYEKWNTEADEQAKIAVYDEFEEPVINNTKYLKYYTGNEFKLNRTPFYVSTISDNVYLEFSFRYLSVIDNDAPWYQMALQLENDIMNSISIVMP